jgi:hypothetical protein
MHDAIYPVVLRKVPVVTQLEIQVQANDDATGYGDRKSQDVDQRKYLVAREVPECGFYKV